MQVGTPSRNRPRSRRRTSSYLSLDRPDYAQTRPIVTTTLAADHRVSDGHRGALFLAEIAMQSIPPVRAALRDEGLRVENSAYGQS